jgi:hypothetical protein
MDREDDAKKRLVALHQPVPRPTKAAVAQNRAEEESRREAGTLDRLMGVVKKGPDFSEAAKVGEPALVDPTPVSARDVVTTSMRLAMTPAGGDHSLSLETVKTGPPAANEPAPRSDAPPNAANADPFARPNTATAADPNELKPASPDAAAPPDPNELKPADVQSSVPGDAPVPPPVQVNEIQQGQSAAGSNTVASSSSSSASALASDQDISTSKKNKKKGWKKIVSF